MGLLLREPSSLNSLTSGVAPPGGTSTISESDPDLDLGATEKPSCRGGGRPLRTTHSRGTSHGDNTAQGLNPSRCAHTPPRRARAARLRHARRPSYPWADDAAEGRALARSDVPLPGDWGWGRGWDAQDRSFSISSSTTSSSSSSSRRSRSASLSPRRRPPSLERQDAFRDERTAKRRRESGAESVSGNLEGEETDQRCFGRSRGERDYEEEQEAAEVAELYRLGLLYDDEHERGEGFSLASIVRPEPVYSLRVRPARKKGGRDAGAEQNFALSVDLAFSAFGEDETLAGWLLSGSAYERVAADDHWAPDASPRDAGRSSPRLTVIYELADDAVSAVSADDFLESVSVSELSSCGGEEENESAWAVLEGCNGLKEDAATAGAADLVEGEAGDGDGDPWVVLGRDGS
ncbi:uncharacterized protein THITE_2130362 [Thermothielavioides terrestris NRRL 8126]|uniref:Uncharacterized protein n=1 Tax=Thermothielavioides terrestris (strain ATCC 38088 / NRRL 8126) TaxID=578455 RepID=G2R943_THETT|nr:uncharacterized protein THITE_2130362 [Thermothielavioides terrestris NRRL 8126]AEO68638.1 hypothetical protein THITE_2130362 [Thermothielavioides terrestris NRRL 8126]